MKSIDLFIAGAQKAGTTSLKNYLGQNPQIDTHQQQEMGYFFNDNMYNLGYEKAYRNFFWDSKQDAHILVAKNVGVMYNSVAIERLYKHNPKILLILGLRNPVNRAYSAYWHARRRGWEDVTSFDRAVWMSPNRYSDPLNQRNCAYLERGLYSEHLQRILSIFPREQVILYRFETLKKNPLRICQEVFQKCGVDPIVPNIGKVHNSAALSWSPIGAKLLFQPSRLQGMRWLAHRYISPRARSQTKIGLKTMNRKEVFLPPMKRETRLKLSEFFQPYNDKLGDILEIDFSDWNY